MKKARGRTQTGGDKQSSSWADRSKGWRSMSLLAAFTLRTDGGESCNGENVMAIKIASKNT